MSTAAIIGGTAAAGLASSAIGAHAAGKAADAQVQAANNAAALQHQDAQDALNFNKQQYGNSLQMLNPYLQTGYGALGLLRQGMGIAGGNYQGFNLPTGSTTASSLQPGSLNLGALRGSGIFNPAINRNPLSNDTNLGTLPSNVRGGGTPQPLQDQTATASPFSSAMAFNGNGLVNGGINPGNASALNPSVPATINGQTVNGTIQNPDIGTFNAGTNGAVTADGSPGMVPRTDGGDVPGGGAAGGVDANGNPNVGFGSLLTPFSEKFSAPTNVTEQNDPGYQFRLNQGMQALQNSAAAKGGLFSGGTAKALNDYAQGSASNEYSNVYNRALNEYLNRYNIFNSNQTNQFNRLASVAGIGQTSANQLSTAGLTTGQNVGNTLLTSGAQIGQDYQNAGAAKGSGYVGSANAITGGINGITNMAQLLAMMKNNPSAGAGGLGV